MDWFGLGGMILFGLSIIGQTIINRLIQKQLDILMELHKTTVEGLETINNNLVAMGLNDMADLTDMMDDDDDDDDEDEPVERKH